MIKTALMSNQKIIRTFTNQLLKNWFQSIIEPGWYFMVSEETACHFYFPINNFTLYICFFSFNFKLNMEKTYITVF